MLKCVDCGTSDNLVYSGVAAFVLGVIELVEKICYDCANLRRESKDTERGFEEILIDAVVESTPIPDTVEGIK